MSADGAVHGCVLSGPPLFPAQLVDKNSECLQVTGLGGPLLVVIVIVQKQGVFLLLSILSISFFFLFVQCMSDSVGKKLYHAASGGRASEVSSLLRDNPGIDVNWANEYQWTPLHVASHKGHVEIVKLLLAHPDISVNLKNGSG